MKLNSYIKSLLLIFVCVLFSGLLLILLPFEKNTSYNNVSQDDKAYATLLYLEIYDIDANFYTDFWVKFNVDREFTYSADWI